MILGYTPISRTFQAPKCVIKAHDPHLQWICVTVEGFLLSEGASIPKGMPLVGHSSSYPVIEEEDELEVEKEEEVVELDSFEDSFEVFD